MPVRLEQIGHSFQPEEWLFRNLNVALDQGTVIALVGPSGSGKSTLLSIIAGITKPSEGQVTGVRGRACWVLQNPYGSPKRTALDHVALPLLGAGQTRAMAEEGAHELLVRFGLAHVALREFQALSGGEAQRLMLARAIAARPALLLVDEPTAQLDRATAASVNRSIMQLATPEIVVVVATHDERTRDACTNALDLGNCPQAEVRPGH